MTTTNQPLTAPEEKTSKTTVFFTALALAALMVSAAGGGAAFMIYHEFSAMPDGAQPSASRGPQTVRMARSSAPAFRADTAPMTRPIAAEASDRSDYQFADNTVLPPAAARRVIAAWTSNPVLPRVPAPLAKTDDTVTAATSDRPPLTDSGSHYIVSPRTGQVIGVDGSAGAAAEARIARAMPVAVAVQTPPPEIRVASPVVVRAAIPVSPDEADANSPQTTADTTGAQYIPVRRALPVNSGRVFDAASYLATQDDGSISRARGVNPTSRAAGYRHDFRLPDPSSQN